MIHFHLIDPKRVGSFGCEINKGMVNLTMNISVKLMSNKRSKFFSLAIT
jgi:hypothetical protein